MRRLPQFNRALKTETIVIVGASEETQYRVPSREQPMPNLGQDGGLFANRLDDRAD